MIFMNQITANLSKMCGTKELSDGFRITTNCMYPSNGLVRVYVKGGENRVVISDEGEAVGEGTAAGIIMKDADKILRSNIKNRGLSIKDGVIFTAPIETSSAHIAILHLANTARDMAHWLYEHGGVKRNEDFRVLLAKYLENSFGVNLSQATIQGASSKPHKFANVISFANGKKFIVDPVAYDPASINSRVVANLDVKAKNDPDIVQRIIFDDMEKWSPADLTLLQIGATLVPFSRAKDVLPRLANEMRHVG